ncbi:NUDIX hydrolase [Alterisphingorhabdus coralli]|uniref:NUDIX hydrolase n=1 Tax=Alterisphingorhabdus coralli TaxID=3071408 RepID=A0AA97I0C6_9SPHN|nr:NUDIX hydrolase [Parasphingorhabdus sp. SCSIO 66989]WOE74268.1 NUDIX hydrolase [Parasphingorhabdus sp. SCSIO 66989]
MTDHHDHEAPEEVMWQGRFITTKRKGRWEYVGRARGIEAGVILALVDDYVLLVEQYRVPLGANCLELPAGLIGDEDANEAPIEAAARELEEETGYRAGMIEDMGRFYSSPGMVSESYHLFRATDCVRISDGGGVGGEEIIVHRVPLREISVFVDKKRAEGCAMDGKLLMIMGAEMMG